MAPQLAKPFVPSILSYDDTCDAWCAAGTRRAESHWSAFIVRSLLTGFYFNISFTLGIRAFVQSERQSIFFGIFFSFGLVFVTLSDSFLFTQDCATITLSMLMKRTRVFKGVRALFLTILFNFIGSIIGAFFLGSACRFFSDPGDLIRQAIIDTGKSKMTLRHGAMFSRAMLSNWMLCLANFLQTKTFDIAGKMICVCLPISALATIGLEHSIMNMGALTLCLFLDEKSISMTDYFANIGLSVLGNCVGGIVTMVLPAFYTLWLKSADREEQIQRQIERDGLALDDIPPGLDREIFRDDAEHGVQEF
jgi:nitrite transporter NirC